MSQPITTTLARIRECYPCESGWRKLLRGLNKTAADDEPLPLVRILEINGLQDAVWCLRACDNIDRPARLFAVECAEQVRHLMKDNRSLAALDVARRHAVGAATDDEIAAACDAARDAAWDAAWDACDAARDAAWDACDAARNAAWDACDAAWAAACDAARDKQADLFRKHFTAKEGRETK